MTETTDPTAAIEVWARMLCAADVHVHGEDHPTWQQLVGEPGSRIRDDYRKAAAWLLPKMTVAAKLPAPADRAAILREAAERVTGHAADHFPDEYDDYADQLADELRRMADEAQQPKICELPHLTIAEEDACEQHRLGGEAQQPETPTSWTPGPVAVARAAAWAQQPETQADDGPPAPLRRSWDDCPGFPEKCPNIRPVDPDPPTHFGGIRCGCADKEPTS
jgi:hypothetical protein